MSSLHLVIATPNGVLVDATDVASVRVRDASGSLGVLPGHADLVSVLPASVVHWSVIGARDTVRHAAAMAGGVVRVAGGTEVRIACREGLVGDGAEALAEAVRIWRDAERELDRQARAEDTRLHAAVLRHITGGRQRGGSSLS